MEYIKLNNGIDMPIVGFGTWDVRGSEGLTALKTAIDIGYRLFDTAEMYANQDIVGKAIRESGIDRSEFFITTKLCRPHIDYNSAKKAIEQDLKTLNTDYIDLLLIHEPYSSANAMYKAFEEAYEQGKVRAIGVSNFSQSFYDNFITNCNIIPTINQVESHVYYPQLELKAHMEKHGTQMQPWGSFTEGRRDIFHEPVLMDIANKHHVTSAQVALRYLIENGIAVIPKSSHKERMKQNIDVFHFTLDENDMELISTLNENQSLFGWY